MDRMRFVPRFFRIVRVLGWAMKAMLLLIAAGVLVLWPMSRGRIFEVWANAEPQLQHLSQIPSLKANLIEYQCAMGVFVWRRQA